MNTTETLALITIVLVPILLTVVVGRLTTPPDERLPLDTLGAAGLVRTARRGLDILGELFQSPGLRSIEPVRRAPARSEAGSSGAGSSGTTE